MQSPLVEEGVEFRQNVFTPLVTLWTFLGQVFRPDHSCREAVARLIAFLVGQGRRPCAAGTGAYCAAPQRAGQLEPATRERDCTPAGAATALCEPSPASYGAARPCPTRPSTTADAVPHANALGTDPRFVRALPSLGRAAQDLQRTGDYRKKRASAAYQSPSLQTSSRSGAGSESRTYCGRP
jgi:hypothetical protein